MATALQAQLAQIAATSTNAVDLKAQRRDHSKSLLYEPAIAAKQDLDTIFDECNKGFQDLCGLDPRFASFEYTLFGEQSKEQDRSQKTADENKTLDAVVESFLFLVAGRLHLKPALFCIEWLVRRFKAQDFNTAALIFTFLPYHALPHSHYTSHAFAALLAILPSKLPDAFLFLERPKHKAPAAPLPPTEHTVVAVATQNDPFYKAFSTYTITSYSRGYGYELLASVWTRVISEAFAGRMDRVGTRKEARQEEENDIVRQILNTLNDGLSVEVLKARCADNFRVGFYTILTVLVSKVQLSDRTLDVLMEAVSGTMSRVSESELVCLAVLSGHKQSNSISRKTCKTLLQDTALVEKLSSINSKVNVEALVLRLFLHACPGFQQSKAKHDLVLQLLQRGLVGKEDLRTAFVALLPFTQGAEQQSSLAEALQSLSHREDLPIPAKEVLIEAGYLQEDQDPAGLIEDNEADSEDSEMDIDLDTKFDEALSVATKQTVDSSPITFLSAQPSATYDLLARTASLAGRSQSAWSKLSALKCFHIKNKESLYISFLLRLCSGLSSPSVRASALTRATDFVQQQSGADFQLLLPYCLVFLADASPLVRKAAAALLIGIQDSLRKTGKSYSVFAKEDMHGSAAQPLLSKAQAEAVLQLCAQNLEEYRLDASHASKTIQDILSGAKATDKRYASLRAADREAILHFLAAAIAATPLADVRVQLVRILDGVSKVGATSKAKALLPFVRKETEETTALDSRLVLGSITERTYWSQLLSTISANSGDGLRLLKDLLDGFNYSETLCESAMFRIKELWLAVKPEKQTPLAVSLFNLVCGAGNNAIPALADTAAETLRSLKLPVPALRGLLDMLPALTDFVNGTTAPAKRRRTSNGHVNGENPDITAPLQQWAFALELVDLSRDRGDPDLLKKLNQLLTEIQSLSSQLGSQVDYVVAVLLDSLNGVVTELTKTSGMQLKTPSISVDALIEIFQSSSSAQVQRSALLLIATLASVYPDAIMHHIMPVFTTMGQSVLKHGDEFSIHVADLAIKSIIPPLLASFRKQKSGLREGMVRVLVSFVVAYDHIPQSRRLPLFSSLAEQLGAEHSLHLLTLLFVDKHGRSRGTEEFVVDLISRHDAMTQLQALKNAIEIVHDACEDRPKSLTSQIVSSKDRKLRLTTALQYVLLASRALQNSSLQRNTENVLSKDNETSRVLRSVYSDIIERVLRLHHSVHSQKKLAAACSQLLDSLLKLLPIHETISGLEPLLTGKDLVVQRQVLKSIEERVGTIRSKDNAAQQSCLALLPKMEVLLQHTEDSKLSQTIISCADSIIERFGKKNPARALDILRTISSARGLSSKDKDVKVMALFCLATAVQTLGESIAQLLPLIIESTFLIPGFCVDATVASETPTAALVKAAYALFAAIIDNVSWAMGKQNTQKLLDMATNTLNYNDLATSTADDRATTLVLLAKRTEARDCISALGAGWSLAANRGGVAMTAHLRVLQTLISALSKANTAKLSPTLLGYFLQVLDIGAQVSQEALQPWKKEELEEVEDLCSEIMVQMIYKLNDTHFRPMFIRLVEWASEEEGIVVLRHAALYKFLYRFFDTLKSIVTSYAGLVLEDAAKILEMTDPDSATSTAWVRVIQTLQAAFENDQDEYFQAPSRFSLISVPLVAQLEQPKELRQEHLAPCIVALASVADSSDNQKAINNAVLGHLRSEDAEVRMAAVDCQRQLTDALSDEWLAHLPEMLPFISEALEDDDEDVQNETRAWVSRIEAIIGESLGPMLQ